jgi:hypothetical protein
MSRIAAPLNANTASAAMAARRTLAISQSE